MKLRMTMPNQKHSQVLPLDALPLKICFVASLLLLFQLKWAQGYNSKTNDGRIVYRKHYNNDYYDKNSRENYAKPEYESPHVQTGFNYESNGKNNGRTTSGKKMQKDQTRVEAVEIPYPVLVGQSVQLKCKWTIGTTGFFSLRWYKNDEQFYTYMKGNAPNIHNLTGIVVTIPESDDHVLTLRNITHDAEGRYKCEIMGESPRFKISYKTENLTVVEQPETPMFLGLRHKYKIGDTLNVTCVAKNGRPKPELIVKVNGNRMQIDSGRLVNLDSAPGDRPGVSTSQARLVLALSQAHSPSFTLGCYAYTHGLQVQKEVNIPVEPRNHFFSIFYNSAGITLSQSGLKTWQLLCLALHLRIKLC